MYHADDDHLYDEPLHDDGTDSPEQARELMAAFERRHREGLSTNE